MGDALRALLGTFDGAGLLGLMERAAVWSESECNLEPALDAVVGELAHGQEVAAEQDDNWSHGL